MRIINHNFSKNAQIYLERRCVPDELGKYHAQLNLRKIELS